jgi:hypothetical protein
MTEAIKILSFYANLEMPLGLPNEVGVLNPFKDKKVFQLIEHFYHKYYNDNLKRTFLIGINPGRFGAGVTGIPFTDPIRLQEVLEIENDLDKKAELSSKFIYDLIEYLGGPKVFFGSFYFTSVSPVGFVKNGKNLNYYDQKDLQDELEAFMVNNLWLQIETINCNRDVAYSLGQGKNFKYLEKLNKEHGFFKRIEPMPHPRWVMQYRLKRKQEFIDLYGDKLVMTLNDLF